ncbi:type I polyketide synthase [Streptomyces sp. NPDC006632]|uniref:type I polyketide synthase n=1 Tax=Streptomyces sp. NPDC006632 TaxID=3157182 RepID=UPI0033AC51E4
MHEKNETYEALLRGALARIEELEAAVDEARESSSRPGPVAIVGMGCRFPGAEGPDAYWKLLSEGRDAVTEVPADRWDIDAYYDPDPDAPGKMSTRHGGFIDGLTQFDASLFGISAREAASIDPQQRLLMEVSWEAFEHAGMPVKSLPARTGVFVGISNVDYREAMVSGGAESLDGYFSSGSTTSTASGRLSYFLGLTGPSLSVDTACSSSAVSVHLAVMNLRSGACDMALAGGVNQIVTPHETISLSKGRMMSPDGRCKPFDAEANGYVRAEGCGMIVLKRLEDARRDGDRILAVIRGSATNQDGHRSGLTVPHGPSQQDVVRRALQDSGIGPEEVGYIEAHGTGTALGDPIEAAALGAVFGERPSPLVVGSVKSNFGHLESAAGIAGVIKTVLALWHAEIPPTLHFSTPNPFIDWDALALRIPTSAEPWTGERRIAGVSSFGFSGTNCHVVLEAAPREPRPATPPADRPVHVLGLSGATEQALADSVRRTAAFVADGADGAALADVCFTANTGRSHLEHRAAVVADSAEHLVRQLTGEEPGLLTGHVQGQRSVPDVAFLFTGQGSQYPGMGAELYRTQPVYRRAIDSCAQILDPLLGRSLTALLHPEPSDEPGDELDRTRFTQPALFAVEYALAQLWRSWGVEPRSVLGHSVGELVAACVAGVFSLADGLRLVAERGRLMQELPEGGVMVSLRGRPGLIEEVVGRYPLVAVAAVNGPEELVISGDGDQTAQAVAELARQGVTSRGLKVSHAFHSPLMASIAEPLTAVAKSVTYAKPRIPVISNVTGGPVGADELCDPAYWVRHALAPVRFADGMRAAYETGARAFVEIGPKPVLLGLGRDCLPDADALWLPSLRPGRDWTELLGSLAALHVRGVAVDWRAFDQEYAAARRGVTLPTYPFQRERHWFTEEQPVITPGRLSDEDWLVGVEWGEAAGEVTEELGGRWLVRGAGGGAGAGVVSGVRVVGDLVEADHVVFVADAVPAPGVDVADRALELSVGLLELVQELAAGGRPVRLRVVTRGGQVVVPGDRVDPAQAALWGLVRTVRAEHPELECSIVDLDADASVEDGLRTSHALSAVRGALRLTPALTPVTETAPLFEGSVGLSSDASYLVTGGLGGLGLRVGEWLAREGAGHVVLAGRSVDPSGLSGEVRRSVGVMEGFGARVHLVAADVSCGGDVERLVAVAEGVAPLRGVVHAAGVLDDGVLGGQSASRFGGVFAPKVRGGVELDRVLRERGVGLDFFVAFSSVAALVPTLGSASYAAANAFLDGLMASRRAQGLPGLSVNWGPWGEVGMGARDTAAYERIGLRMIPPDQGARITVKLACGAAPSGAVGVVGADWTTFRDALGEGLPAGYLAAFTETAAETGSVRATSTAAAGARAAGTGTGRPLPGQRPGQQSAQLPSLRAELAAADDRRAFLAAQVERMLREVLGSRSAPGPHQGFFSLGMDSLMAVEFRARLTAGLELRLPTTVAFTYPTLDELVSFLADELGITPAAGDPGPERRAAPTRTASGAPTETPSETPAEASASDLMARIAEKYRTHRST